MESLNDYRSCASHCCKNHGCKYGYEKCPVSTGAVAQEHLCEHCTWDLEDALTLDSSRIYRERLAGTRVVIGFGREDGSIENIPSDEEMLEKIQAALEGLEVAPGWTIKFAGF